MAKDKPTVSEIKDQFTKDKNHYTALRSCYEDDETFYELDFKSKLNVADQFSKDRVIVPSARDVVDAAINHTDIMNARVLVDKKNTSGASNESAEMLRKLALGLIHRTNVESSIAPGRVGAKHFWMHGLAVYKTVWDADRWRDKPDRKDNESEDAYKARIDEWRSGTYLPLPIVIQPINPANIVPDPSTGGEQYVYEYHTRTAFSTKLMYPRWKNPLRKKDSEDVEYISWWSGEYRCELIDGQPMLRIKGGVVDHKYDFIPYTLIESGLGNLSKEARPEMRYVGLNRYIFDMLVSESTNYTLCDIKMKREIMKGGWITGDNAGSVKKVTQAYGEYTPVPEGVEFHDWESKMAPEAAYMHLGVTKDYIAGHAAPRSVRGQSETGVRSGADRRLVLAEAAAIYQYAAPAFAHGWSNILNKCARLAKNVIPGEFQVWGNTEGGKFDVTIKKDKLREPFNYYIDFGPISPEDEYRRHDDLIRRGQAGLIDERYAWERQNDVDPDVMEKRMKKKQLRSSPAYLQSQDMMMAQMFQQAAQAAGIQLPLPMEGTEQVAPGGVTGNAMPRRNVPTVREANQLGSLGQGDTGGGNRG